MLGSGAGLAPSFGLPFIGRDVRAVVPTAARRRDREVSLRPIRTKGATCLALISSDFSRLLHISFVLPSLDSAKPHYFPQIAAQK
jgi:hypothetical protein